MVLKKKRKSTSSKYWHRILHNIQSNCALKFCVRTQDTHSDQREIIFDPTCVQFVRHALVRLPVLHLFLLLLLLELLLLPLGEFPLEAGVLLRGLADVAGLVNPPEQEPALPVVVVPAELHQ